MGSTADTRGSSRTRSCTRCTSAAGKYVVTPVRSEPLAIDCARSKPERCAAEGMNTTSSALPSTPATTVRTDWLIVSPVVKALDRITVPSVRPSVISAAKPGRRGRLRHAKRGSSGLRQAATASTAITLAASTRSLREAKKVPH